MKKLILLLAITLMNCSSTKEQYNPSLTTFNRLYEKANNLLGERNAIIFFVLPKDCHAPGTRPCKDCSLASQPILILEKAQHGFIVHTATKDDSTELKSLHFYQEHQEIYVTSYYSLVGCLGNHVVEDIIVNNRNGVATKKISLTELLPYTVEYNSLFNLVQDSTSVFTTNFCGI